MNSAVERSSRRGYLAWWRAVPSAVLFLGLVALPVALLVMTVLIIMFSLGLALSVIVIGLPVMALSLVAARSLSERWAALLAVAGIPITVEHAERDAPAGARGWGAMIWALRSEPHWWALVHGVLVAPLISVVSFAVTWTWLALVLGGLTQWFWGPATAHITDDAWAVRLVREIAPWLTTSDSVSVTMLYTVIGAVALLTLPLVMQCVALLHRGAARFLLGGADAVAG